MVRDTPHPKMYPHTKFGIPTSINIGDMDQNTKAGRTDRRSDSAFTICLPKFLRGHNETGNLNTHNICDSRSVQGSQMVQFEILGT